MKSPHTPGPWTVGVEYGNHQDEINGPNGNAICTVWTRKGRGPRPCFKDDPEGKANARLIAAAPELLEACKFVLSQLDQTANGSQIQCKLYSDCLAPDSTDDDKTIVDYLREIVAKAEDV